MIGVLDSGVGGLCALRALRRLCPEENILYLADGAHLPYGARKPEEIRFYTARALSFFLAQGVDRVLIACGTASAYALDFCRKSFPFPVFGVLTPASLAAAKATRSLRIGVAATEATVKSGVYPRLLRRFAPGAEVFSLPAPRLVGLAEEGNATREEVYHAIGESLAPLREARIDTLLLGCTHFSLFKNTFASYFPEARLIDAAPLAAEALLQTFCPRKEKGILRLFTTAEARPFSERATELLGQRVRATRIMI